MIKPVIPPNDKERIEELLLHGILDTDPEEEFDAITKLAASIFEMPVSFISIVDENRQWLKSRVGIDITETPRDISFCAHAINNPAEVLVVNDARLDPRFNENPQVVNEPHLVFYAGAPLISEDGFALGTLCLVDFVPREFPPDKISQLQILAAQVAKLLELKKKNEQLNTRNRENVQLLKEIHHRVKNNLQIISSLLNLQISQSSAPEAMKALETSRDRILAISLIHQQLYQEKNLEDVNFKNYLTNLIESFNRIYYTVENDINVEEIQLPLDIAVPLSLIVSELLTNAYKHAFHMVEDPKITLEFKSIENDNITLQITDNGKGFDLSKKWENSETLGFEIVKNLTEQINGSISCASSERGTYFLLTFPMN